MPREKAPGIAVEEAKARLRLEEVEADVPRCEACAKARAQGDDPTAMCQDHLRRVLGL